MGFSLFKKNKNNVPPDVGQEEKVVKDAGDEIIDDETEEDSDDLEEAEETPKKSGKKTKSDIVASSKVDDERINLEFQKIGARLESLNELIKGYGERIFNMGVQIGEVRSMTLANEKNLGKLGANAEKAIDIVKEVKPDRLRTDFQKLDLKMQEMDQRVESKNQFMETIMNELKDVRKKVGTFIGTEELLRLNDEIKKDLIETQHMVARAQINADKTEALFAEVKRSMSENKKLSEEIIEVEASVGAIQKDIQKIKIDFSNIVRKDDLDDFEKNINKKTALINNEIENIDRMKEENQRLSKIIETMLGVVQQNQKDIADIAMSIGDDHIKRASDYDDKLDSVLKILDALAGKVNILEKKFGKKEKKIYVDKNKQEKVRLKHIDIGPEIRKNLKAKKSNQNVKMIKIYDEKKNSMSVLDKSLKDIDKNIKMQKDMLKKLR